MRRITGINPMQAVEAYSVRPKRASMGVKKPRKNPFAALPQVGGKRVVVQSGKGVRKGANPEI